MAKLPNKIQDIVDEKQAYIDNNRGRLESSVIKMQEELLKQFIEEIVPEIETKDGQILNTAKNLRLIEKLDDLYTKFNNTTQTNVVKDLGQSFLGLSKFNNKYFGEIALNEVTSKRFDKVMTDTNDLMSARLGITKKGEVNTGGFLDSFVTDRTLLTELKQSIIQNVTGQQSLASFKEFIKTKIVGTPEVSGGFEKYYRTFAYDAYQSYDRAYGKTVADEFGMDYAIYQGGLIEESRDFCKAHENKVFTRGEISEFDKWVLPKDSTESPGPGEVPSYIAKFPNYSPEIDCGGYNCRHSLSWIPKAMAERLRPDLKQTAIIDSQPKLSDTSKQFEDHLKSVQMKSDYLDSQTKYATDKLKKSKQYEDLANEQIMIDKYQKSISKLSPEFNSENFDNIKKFTNFKGTHEELWGDGNIIASSVKQSEGKLTATVLTKDGYLQRTFDPKSKVVSMDEFYLNPLIPKGSGTGSKMFANQVEEFKKLGFTKLVTEAGNAAGMNGYYTWARLGYNIGNKQELSIFKSLLKISGEKEFSKIGSLNELISSPKGRAWWKENGSYFNGEFDLREGSNSMNTLSQYMKKKK